MKLKNIFALIASVAGIGLLQAVVPAEMQAAIDEKNPAALSQEVLNVARTMNSSADPLFDFESFANEILGLLVVDSVFSEMLAKSIIVAFEIIAADELGEGGDYPDIIQERSRELEDEFDNLGGDSPVGNLEDPEEVDTVTPGTR